MLVIVYLYNQIDVFVGKMAMSFGAKETQINCNKSNASDGIVNTLRTPFTMAKSFVGIITFISTNFEK